MLYLVLGNDREAQKRYLNNLEKNIGGTFTYIDKYTFSQEYFESHIFGTSIFGEQQHIVLDEVCETRELQDYISVLATEIKNAASKVVILQKDLPDDFKELLQSNMTEVVEYKLASQRPDFSLWAAYFARDKKASWIAYCMQVESEPAEKIHGGLLSQTKNMYKTKIASEGSSYKQLGFSTQKSMDSAATASKKFTKAELSEMYFSLVEMPLLAHNGETDFKLALEKFIITYL